MSLLPALALWLCASAQTAQEEQACQDLAHLRRRAGSQTPAPDSLVATHRTAGKVDNERPICAFPAQAVYTGPAGDRNERAKWVAGNFTCR